MKGKRYNLAEIIARYEAGELSRPKKARSARRARAAHDAPCSDGECAGPAVQGGQVEAEVDMTSPVCTVYRFGV